jgi:hypothetical protein
MKGLTYLARMRAGGAFLGFAMVTIVLSGCLEKPALNPTTDDEIPALDPKTMRTIVHALDGEILDEALYGGDLPQMIQQYVGKRGSGEPTIAVTSKNVAFYPSIEFDAAGGLLARTEIYRSRDNGTTWQEVTPQLGGQDMPPQSLDPYVYADPITDRVFTIDLYVGCSWLIWTDNEGATWTHNPIACGVPVNDHQTLFSGRATVLPTVGYGPSILYYCNNQVADVACTHSTDGGLTWAPGQNPFLGIRTPAEGGQPGICGGLHGHGHASAVDGIVYLPKGHCGEAWVAVSRDNGLTWSQVLVDRTVGFDGHEAIVSTDAKGNAYYFFLDRQTYPRLSISRDQGRTWSAPMNVSVPGLTAAKFPSIVAGDEGRLAFLYVGTTNPYGFGTNSDERVDATWNAYVGFSLNALDEEPVFVTTTPHPLEDPLKRGDCRGRCQGMYDFLDITINPQTGQVWTALVDLCNDECARPEGSAGDRITSRGAVGVQTGGARLRL